MAAQTILFPSSPIKPYLPDKAFEQEAKAATAAGFKIALVEEGIFGSETRIRKLEKGEGQVIYRGWLMRPERYGAIEEIIKELGYSLLASRKEYEYCYHFPNWYQSVTDNVTPHSIWFPGKEFDLDVVTKDVEKEFGNSPVILKDYVKSRKHEWYDACYMGSAADSENVKRVIKNFIKLQGDELVGGLVFRKFINLKRIGIHSKSSMPLSHEYRFFIRDKKILHFMPYWSEGKYEATEIEWYLAQDTLKEVPACIQSQFYAMDVGQKEDGGWTIVEINDGGAAGIPGDNTDSFYKSLAENNND